MQRLYLMGVEHTIALEEGNNRVPRKRDHFESPEEEWGGNKDCQKTINDEEVKNLIVKTL